MTHLRFKTYLAPGIPSELFRVVVDGISRELGLSAELLLESRFSGLPRNCALPEDALDADFAWICTSPDLWSRELPQPAIQLVPAGLVFNDPRLAGQPAYYSDVIVRRDHSARGLEGLRGCRWAYNDAHSHSGFYNLLRWLEASGESPSFFGEVQEVGSHRASIARVAHEEADVAAIDSNVLRSELARRSELAEAIRVLCSLGPNMVQPLVASASVDRRLVERVGAALLRLHEDGSRAEKLRALGLEGFCPVHEDQYRGERAVLLPAEFGLRGGVR